MFVNYLGIPEDPATGSATGCLAGYLLKTHYFNSASIDLTVGQGYEMGRPSQLRLKANKIDSNYEIKIGGRVIEIAEGEWKTGFGTGNKEKEVGVGWAWRREYRKA